MFYRSKIVFLLLLTCWTEAIVAQPQSAFVGEVQPASHEATAKPVAPQFTISPEQIQVDLEALKAAGLAEKEHAETETRLKKALQNLQAENEHARSAKQWEKQTAQLPESQAAVAEEKAALEANAELPALNQGTVAELESQLQDARNRRKEAETAAHEATKQAEERLSRIEAIQNELANLQRKLSESIAADIQAAEATDLPTRSLAHESLTRRQSQQAKAKKLEAELTYLQSASEYLSTNAVLTTAKAKRWASVVETWEKQVDQARRQEADRQAKITRQIVEKTHPRLRPIAQQNNEIAAIRQEVARQIDTLSHDVKDLATQTETLRDDFTELKQKVDFAGTSSSTGIMLRKMRSELPPPEELRHRDEFIATETPKVHLRLIEWKKAAKAITDTESVSEKLLTDLNEAESKLPLLDVQDALPLRQLLEDRKVLLQSAIADYESYLRLLNQMDLQGRQLHEQVDEARVYLDQRVLWMRSHERLSADDLKRAAIAFGSLFSPRSWIELFTTLAGGLISTWYGVIALGCVLMSLWLFQSQMQRWQSEWMQLPKDRCVPLSRSLLAIALSGAMSAHWPLLLMAIGYRLHNSAEDAWTAAVGHGCLAVVPLVWGCEFLRSIGKREGIGERMFGWPPSAAAEVRKTIVSVLFVGTPLFVLLSISRACRFTEQDSLNRVLFLIILSWWSLQIARLLRPSGRFMNSISSFEQETGGTFLYRHRRILAILLTAAPAVFAAISVWGYHESARQLLGRLVESGGLVVLTLLAYFVVDRWVAVINHNRTVEHQQSESELGEEAQTATLEEGDVTTVRLESAPSPVRELPMEDLRGLFRFAMLSILMVGGWFIWSEVLPALHVLDQFVVWSRVVEVSEMVTAEDGTTSLQKIEKLSPTTLTDLCLAIAVILGTLKLARRAPTFMEVFVLERLPIEPGARQATKILIGYAINLAGLLLACNLLSLSWSSVQWLAAAMTVGLGFGLQEIFGNLVSGLIILFERPIRVGDVVTVGDTTGTITRMQMRATTITDYDRRELIVPNKKFITDNVVNWTLSDPISRMVLQVGVAYGTDVQQVQAILLKIAKSNPHVLSEPEPSTLFSGFGNSTLDFELRVFIPTRDVYIQVKNQLNAAIAREFEAHEIEIAFPQMDLHIRRQPPHSKPDPANTSRRRVLTTEQRVEAKKPLSRAG